MKPISEIVQATPPSGIRRFFDIVSQMHDVISLGVGEPDFDTPWRVSEACVYSLERGHTHYTSNYGMLELRKAISEYLHAHERLKYNPEDQILITVGVSEGMDLAMRAILNPGDEVIVAEPCYVSYKPCVVFAGGVPVVIPSTFKNEFRITPEQVAAAITPRTKAILISYPSNPTGATATRGMMESIVKLAREHDLYIISDEIYDRLTYDGVHTCLPTIPGAYERTILLNGFSKAYAMTGWRIALRGGPDGYHRCDDEDSPVYDALRAGDGPDRRAGGHHELLPRERRDDRAIRPAQAGNSKGPDRRRAAVPHAGRRVLCVPLDQGDGPDLR